VSTRKPFDSEKARAKAYARWQRRKELRARADHCSHCGRLHDRAATGRNQCPKCLATAKAHRQQRPKSLVEIGRSELHRLEKRIAAVEHYCAHLRTFGRIEYNRGYVAGRRLHRAAQERASYREAMPSASFEDLSQISHAYAR
jgi:hypothetical protein